MWTTKGYRTNRETDRERQHIIEREGQRVNRKIQQTEKEERLEDRRRAKNGRPKERKERKGV
jgi:hypothetical protein